MENDVVADRIALHELVSLHGHLTDSGDLDRYDQVFTADVVYDVQDLGVGVISGVEALVEVGRRLGERNPLAHHVTNVVVVELADASARVRSKGLGLATDGTVASVVYEDEVVRTPDGWRIARRVVTARRRPLEP